MKKAARGRHFNQHYFLSAASAKNALQQRTIPEIDMHVHTTGLLVDEYDRRVQHNRHRVATVDNRVDALERNAVKRALGLESVDDQCRAVDLESLLIGDTLKEEGKVEFVRALGPATVLAIEIADVFF